MKRAQSPNIEPHRPYTEHPTPTKAKLQDPVEYAKYLQRNSLIHIKQRAHDYFKVFTRSEKRILAQNDAETDEQDVAESARRDTYNSLPESRDAKLKIQSFHVRYLRSIIRPSHLRKHFEYLVF